MSNATPSWWSTVPIVFILFFGGGFAGIRLANLLAPDSVLAEFISFLALPMSFVVGVISWLGTAAFLVLKRRVGKQKEHSGSSGMEIGKRTEAVPPGSKSFVLASAIPCAVAGVIVGVLSKEFGFVSVLCAYIGVGICYGVICWKLAETGYLPFPDE